MNKGSMCAMASGVWLGKAKRGVFGVCGFFVVTVFTLSAQLPKFKLPGRKKAEAKAAKSGPWIVKPEWVRAHEEFLASDALQGRGSATHNEELAADYVATQFAAYGLTPAPGAPAFKQSIDVVAPVLDGKATLEAGNVVLTEGDDMQLLVSPGVTASGVLQRIAADQVGKAEVAKGAAVLIVNVPKDSDLPKLLGPLRRSGAALVLVRGNESTRKYLERIGGKARVPIRLKDDGSGPRMVTVATISEAAASGLENVRDGQKVTLNVHAETSPRATFNVVGFLAGTDPASGVLLLTAHLDHLGVGTPVDGDAIYNGANDDAAGTTAVLELAHALAAGPKPKRSILFVCYGSEEAGELGSEYFGKHPPVPLTSLVANLEFEMIGNQDPKMPKDTLLLTGWDRSNLGATLKEHGAKLGPDPYPEQHFFERSDNYQLALEGVVAHTAAGWGVPPTYHQPNDDVAHLDFDFMTSAIQSLIEPIRWLAANDFKPAWFPGQQPHR